MIRWLDRLSDEGHASERIAGWFHFGMACGYGAMIFWHLFSARRHWRASR